MSIFKLPGTGLSPEEEMVLREYERMARGGAHPAQRQQQYDAITPDEAAEINRGIAAEVAQAAEAAQPNGVQSQAQNLIDKVQAGVRLVDPNSSAKGSITSSQTSVVNKPGLMDLQDVAKLPVYGDFMREQIDPLQKYDQSVEALQQFVADYYKRRSEDAKKPQEDAWMFPAAQLIDLVDGKAGSATDMIKAYQDQKKKKKTQLEIDEEYIKQMGDVLKQRSGLTNADYKYLRMLVGQGDQVKNVTEAKVDAGNEKVTPPKAGSQPKPFDIDKALKEHTDKMSALENIRTTFEQLETDIGGLDKWDGKADIPGMGLEKSNPAAVVGDLIRGNKSASRIRATYDALRLAVQQATAGQAVTPHESQSLLNALGADLIADDKKGMVGLANFKRKLKEIYAQREARFRARHPEVLDAYRTGGGRTSDQITAPNRYKWELEMGPPVIHTQPPAGGLDEAKKKRLEELRKKAGKK